MQHPSQSVRRCWTKSYTTCNQCNTEWPETDLRVYFLVLPELFAVHHQAEEFKLIVTYIAAVPEDDKIHPFALVSRKIHQWC
jgi:hypothetical protein